MCCRAIRRPGIIRSSANPKESYTLLNREAPEFVRFVNPSDYRVARRSLRRLPPARDPGGGALADGDRRDVLGGASYNNGILPYKNLHPRRGLYPRRPAGEGRVARQAAGHRHRRRRSSAARCRRSIPLPTWQVMPPADIFRVFERGGRTIGTQFPEIGLPNSTGEIQRLEEPGRPDIRQSNRGPGTGLRVAIPVLNIHKTRLNDPFMWFMGTNDQPGDYRQSGCAGLPRGLCQRPRAARTA